MPLKAKLVQATYSNAPIDVPIVTTNVTGKGMLRIVGLWQNTTGASTETVITIEIDGEVYVNTTYQGLTGQTTGVGIGIASPQGQNSTTGQSVANTMRTLNVPFEKSLRVVVIPKYASYTLTHVVDYILEV